MSQGAFSTPRLKRRVPVALSLSLSLSHLLISLSLFLSLSPPRSQSLSLALALALALSRSAAVDEEDLLGMLYLFLEQAQRDDPVGSVFVSDILAVILVRCMRVLEFPRGAVDVLARMSRRQAKLSFVRATNCVHD